MIASVVSFLSIYNLTYQLYVKICKFLLTNRNVPQNNIYFFANYIPNLN